MKFEITIRSIKCPDSPGRRGFGPQALQFLLVPWDVLPNFGTILKHSPVHVRSATCKRMCHQT